MAPAGQRCVTVPVSHSGGVVTILHDDEVLRMLHQLKLCATACSLSVPCWYDCT